MQMMQRIISSLTLSAFLLAAPCGVRADEVNAIFKKVNELIAAQNYSKALDELGWARKEIEKLHFKRLESFFPTTVIGLTGQKIQSNSALGMLNLEREYQGTDGASVKIALSGGSSAGGAGLGNLAALGKMAAMMGGGDGGADTIRLNGRTATVESNPDASSAAMTIFLDSGFILSLSMDGSSDTARLKSVAEGVKIEELDTYLKGA